MKAFISYSHRDRWALDRLHTHLSMLRREGRIQEWFDREILPGSEFDEEIAAQLEDAGIFLLLVSPDFLASDYCYDREMTRALQRHDAGDARVIPIIVDSCDWKASPLRRLKALPRDGLPITEWTNQSTAFLDVVTELRRVVGDGDRQVNDPLPALQNQPANAPRYRVRRHFDEIDIADFRAVAFNEIQNYFSSAIAEIDQIDGLRARYRSLTPLSFSCTLINRAKNNSKADITIHGRSGNIGLGDIYYSYAENAPDNTANGSFVIENDEFDLFLKSGIFGLGRQDQRLTPRQAAELLWINFLEQAGVSHE